MAHELKPVWWNRFFLRLCEIPDRNSPDDEPKAIVATEHELWDAYLSTIEEMQEETNHGT